MRLLLPVFLLLCVTAVDAAVEIKSAGKDEATVIVDLYRRDGTLFLPVTRILAPLALQGEWDAGRHLYRLSDGKNEALLSPASRYLRCNGKSITLKQKPRFIDNTLCVSEQTVSDVLPRCFDREILYRNLDAPENGDAPAADAAATATQRPRYTILIDPGHGGADAGALSAAGVTEKEIVLAVADALSHELQHDENFDVRLSRDGDYAIAAEKRQPAAGVDGASAVLVSLHISSWPSSEAQGATFFLRPLPAGVQEQNAPDGRLAAALTAGLAGEGIGVVETLRMPLVAATGQTVPAIVVELGYLSSPEDLQRLRSTDGRSRTARGLAAGIRTYLQSLAPEGVIDVQPAL